jgi:NADPH:quinone reductase-like Zn-dependent oxidoreductase
MKAIVYDKYGSPEVMRLENVPTPTPAADELLVRIVATTINAYDWDLLTASTWLTRIGAWNSPRHRILGCDFAGVVERVGSSVRNFAIGDAVMGDLSSRGFGAFAEYVSVAAKQVVAKPGHLSFEEAATLPQAGTLALQTITSHDLGPGSRVLINGGGGGAGTFAIQMAKNARAEVTAIDAGGKLELMKSLGADTVYDYTTTDFTKLGERFDLIMDVNSHRSPIAYQQCLRDNGVLVVIGGKIRNILAVAAIGWLIGRRRHTLQKVLLHRPNTKDFTTLAEMTSDGAVRPVIDRSYTLSEIPEGLTRLGEGKTLGKLTVRVAASAGGEVEPSE